MIVDLEYETFSHLLHCDMRITRCSNYTNALVSNLIRYSGEMEELLDTRLYVRDYFSQVIRLLPYHVSLADAISKHSHDILVPDLIYASPEALPGLNILTDIFPFVEYKLFRSIYDMEKEVLRLNGKELGEQGSGDNLSDRVLVHTFRPIPIDIDCAAEQFRQVANITQP